MCSSGHLASWFDSPWEAEQQQAAEVQVRLAVTALLGRPCGAKQASDSTCMQSGIEDRMLMMSGKQGVSFDENSHMTKLQEAIHTCSKRRSCCLDFIASFQPLWVYELAQVVSECQPHCKDGFEGCCLDVINASLQCQLHKVADSSGGIYASANNHSIEFCTSSVAGQARLSTQLPRQMKAFNALWLGCAAVCLTASGLQVALKLSNTPQPSQALAILLI